MIRTGNQRDRKRTPWVAAAALCCALITLSACSSGGSDSDGSEPAGNSSNGASTMTKLTVGIASPTFQDADVIVAKEAGLFEKYGLDVTIAPLNGSSALAAALKSDSIQIGEGDGTASATAILSGLDEVFFGNAIPVFPMELWARKGIDSVSDLKGKKMGAASAGSLTQIATTAVLKKFGMTMSDVKLVNLSNPSAKWAALKSGAVDASLGNPPGGDVIAKETNDAVTMIYNAAALPNLSNGYVTKSSYAKDHGDVLTAFLKATREAIVQIKNEPDKVKPMVQKYSKETDESLVEIGYKYYAPLFTLDPSISTSLLTDVFTNAATAKGEDVSSVDVASHYDGQFADKLKSDGFIDQMEQSVNK